MKYPSYFSDTLPIDCIKNRARSVPFVRSRNRNSLSELLIGFFRYFASFDFKKVISIRRAEVSATAELSCSFSFFFFFFGTVFIRPFYLFGSVS